MISSYADLQAAVFAWLLRNTTDRVVTPTQVQTYIQLAEAEMNRVLNIRDLEQTATLTTVSNGSAPLPADFWTPITVNNLVYPFDLDFQSRRNLIDVYLNQSGPAQGYTIFGSNVYFGPAQGVGYQVTLDYYAAIPPLATNSTNVILTKYPDFYLYSALKQGLLQIQDTDKLNNIVQQQQSILTTILQADMMSKIPTGTRARPKNSIGG